MFFNNTDKRYNQYSAYLKNKFGAKVYKITLDAGFSCPNRDGTISTGGCIFCDDGGSFSQAHTNTYKPVVELEKIYKSSLTHPDVVGISIGTRPDCVDDDKLNLISDISKDYYTWIEYGLQSIHDKTLLKINRGHDFDCFLKAYEKTKEKGINVCVHVILGLWETKDEMIETAQKLAELKIDGIKIHMLCALKDTKLSKMYENDEIDFMTEEEYVNSVCDFLEILPPETTIHRLAGNGLKKNLIAPKWLGAKLDCLNKIDRELIKRNSFQGSKYPLQTR